MKLNDLVTPPADIWPINGQENYLILKSRIADFDIPDGTRVRRTAPLKDLIMVFSRRAKRTPIEGVENFLETLEELKEDEIIWGVGFDLPGGSHVFVIVDEQHRYVTHFIKNS